MANIAEDQDSGMEQKPYPQPGQQWRHIETGHVVKVWRLCIGYWGLVKSLEKPLRNKGTAKNRFPEDAQCILYVCVGDNAPDEYCIRTIEDFREKFELCD